MSTIYPGSKQTFTDPAGTSLVTSPDHAQLHTDVNDTIEAIQDTIGTTAGTNVLKDFSAGQFPVRTNSGGTLLQVLSNGTINGVVIGTPSVTGGTMTTAVINNSTLGTPAITGGTATAVVINNPTVGTPNITGGTATGLTLSGTLLIGGTIAQTGAADHITLVPGANKLVKSAVLRQDNTTNTYKNGVIRHHGWGFMQGEGNTSLEETINFGVTFASSPIPIGLVALGYTTSVPDSVDDFNNNMNNAAFTWVPGLKSVGVSSMVIALRSTGTAVLGTANYYGYSWAVEGDI